MSEQEPRMPKGTLDRLLDAERVVVDDSALRSAVDPDAEARDARMLGAPHAEIEKHVATELDIALRRFVGRLPDAHTRAEMMAVSVAVLGRIERVIGQPKLMDTQRRMMEQVLGVKAQPGTRDDATVSIPVDAGLLADVAWRRGYDAATKVHTENLQTIADVLGCTATVDAIVERVGVLKESHTVVETVRTIGQWLESSGLQSSMLQILDVVRAKLKERG